MLNDSCFFSEVYIAPGRTDMRRGIDGLYTIVKQQFRLDPFRKNVLFLFCGRKQDRIKGLVWDGLSEDFCYPHIFQIIAMSSRKPSGKCADKSFYLRPQSLAISFSSSGHSFSSFLEITRPSPCSITAFFCSREGKA